MIRKKLQYIAAWLVYAAFSYFLFPELKITVMQLSIPLTMLGGWLYTYRGAFATTLLTIPFHYFLLSHHTDAPDVIREAFNPFGIGTQLFFSLSTALLKITQMRYEILNDSLERMVKERTQSLSRLAGHLVETKDRDIKIAEAALIDEPRKKLNEMMETSRQLTEKLEQAKHPTSETAKTIAKLIGVSLEQLSRLEMSSRQTSQIPKKTYASIHQLTDEFMYIAGNTTKITVVGNWENLKHDMLQGLSPIIHEALSNAFRHAKPSNITVGLQINPRALVASVENDGLSFMTGINDGMGIPLMRYHAQRIGAVVTIHSTPQQNTRIQCVIPNRGQ